MTRGKWGKASTAERRRRAKNAADARRCPTCKRKGALKREDKFTHSGVDYPATYTCRWCDWTGDFTDVREARAQASPDAARPEATSPEKGVPPARKNATEGMTPPQDKKGDTACESKSTANRWRTARDPTA